MSDQLYTLLDVTRLPIGGWAKFLRTTTQAAVHRRERLGGLLNYYYRKAA